MLNRLAEIKIPLLERFEKWQATTSSAQSRSVPESTHPKKLAVIAERRNTQSRNTQSRGANPQSSSTPASSSDSQVTTNDAQTHSRTRTKGLLERHKQLVAPVLPDPPGVVNVPSTKVAGASNSVNMLPLLVNGIDRLSS